jgi:hypothetical protein
VTGKVFIERDKDGTYIIRRDGRIVGRYDTQAEAIERANQLNATVEVSRVRNTRYGKRDKWRRP